MTPDSINKFKMFANSPEFSSSVSDDCFYSIYKRSFYIFHAPNFLGLNSSFPVTVIPFFPHFDFS